MEELTLWECRTPQDTAYFWERLREYFLRDLYPGATGTPWREDYPQNMQALHEREENPLHYILFRKNRQNIGLAMTVIYLTEDRKQFILEFCVFPEFRGMTHRIIRGHHFFMFRCFLVQESIGFSS